ncbi:hypothetical protein TRFO_13624 [Tritrichomonas foetus]|uniref:Uncharacterized protein n=1 Tax=Tritrichomonas foetus TaxID=1144522 RepID=A0A1J4KYI9_9EUKA|nr:hypothetical protein TRFO_13624 [Tritrichomonas foetus]|eukprot:OHT15944.1 hypothetical protein TRFO_13624 [Tritrichomonas foetus]
MTQVSNKKITRKHFTREEDDALKKAVYEIGDLNWKVIAKKVKNRDAKQCKDRWTNYLSPDISKRQWTALDEQILVENVFIHGKRWKALCPLLGGRSEIELKNRYYLIERRLKKKQEKSKSRYKAGSHKNKYDNTTIRGASGDKDNAGMKNNPNNIAYNIPVQYPSWNNLPLNNKNHNESLMINVVNQPNQVTLNSQQHQQIANLEPITQLPQISLQQPLLNQNQNQVIQIAPTQHIIVQPQSYNQQHLIQIDPLLLQQQTLHALQLKQNGVHAIVKGPNGEMQNIDDDLMRMFDDFQVDDMFDCVHNETAQ